MFIHVPLQTVKSSREMRIFEVNKGFPGSSLFGGLERPLLGIFFEDVLLPYFTAVFFGHFEDIDL